MAKMIVDKVEDRILPAEANAPPAPAVITGVESRVEAATAFGPIRTVHRSYRAESSEALGSARRLRESRDECQHIIEQLRQVCEYYQGREMWWRNGVESMQMQHSEREQERDELLEASQEEWTVQYAELQSTAAAASQRMHDQHQLVEALANRLQATENTANEEVNRLRTDANEMQ